MQYIYRQRFFHLLKEIIIAVESYFDAHRFIRKHRLWKWILLPGLIYTLLFVGGMWAFWNSSGEAIHWLSRTTGLQAWLQRQQDNLLSFVFIMAAAMLQLVTLLLYFSLFKYLFLIIGSPVFAYLSEKTASILEGKDFPFSWKQLLKDAWRGARIAVRNSLWQVVYLLSLLLLSLLPVVGWVAPVIALFVECYYYGFSMLDYNCERAKLTVAESIDFIGKHKGLAIGNGLVFYLLHSVIIIGWILAPAYAVVAATLSVHKITAR